MSSRIKTSSHKSQLAGIKRKSRDAPSTGEKTGGVYESAPHIPPAEDRQTELMLAEIITRLNRIEEKIDENIYPPESAIKPEFIRRVKKAQTDIRKGKGKMYNSIEDFFKEIEA